MIGSSIGNYKILEKLNAAETIGVYKAVDTLLDRDVYIKVLGQKHSEQAAENFRFEAEILAKLVHSGVPTLHSLTASDNRLFMIVEFLEGETLDKLVRRQGKLSAEKAVSIFAEVLDCLEFAHNAGIAHGNLKAEKIFLTETGDVKILDFGTSENFFIDNKGENTALKQQPKIEKIADKDVYAVAKMLFEVLTDESLLANGIEDAAQRLWMVNPAVPEQIIKAVVKVFHRQTEEKSQTAAELRRELARAVLNGYQLPQSSAVFNSNNADLANILEKSQAAVYSVDFSRNEHKFAKRKIRRNWSKRRSASKIADDVPINWTLAQKNLWVGGTGILAIIFLHFFFQFSFVKNDAARTEKELTAAEQISEVKPPVEVEQTAEAKPEQTAEVALPAETKQAAAADPFIEKNAEQIAEVPTKYAEKAATKTEKREVSRKPSISSPPVQTRIKSAPPRPAVDRKEPAPETRAERLRRAEKILTGA